MTETQVNNDVLQLLTMINKHLFNYIGDIFKKILVFALAQNGILEAIYYCGGVCNAQFWSHFIMADYESAKYITRFGPQTEILNFEILGPLEY